MILYPSLANSDVIVASFLREQNNAMPHYNNRKNTVDKGAVMPRKNFANQPSHAHQLLIKRSDGTFARNIAAHNNSKRSSTRRVSPSPLKVLSMAAYEGGRFRDEQWRKELDSVIGDSDSPEVDELRSQRAAVALRLAGGMKVRDASIDEAFDSVQEPDGGMTYDIHSKAPTVGFGYSPYPERSVGFPSADDIHVGDIFAFWNNNKDLLETEDHYIGLWNDPKDGQVWLDVSKVTMDASEARDMCEKKDQKAYFDFQDFHSVKVNENATSGQGA